MSAAVFRAFTGPVVAGVVVMCVSALHLIAPVEASVRDLFLRIIPARAARHVAVVAIDDPSLLIEGSWPWPRQRLASLVSRIADSGAAVVGIDLLLADTQPGDAELAAACRRVRCVLATALDRTGNWMLPASSLGRDVHPAHAAFELDDDGILRRLSATKQNSSVSFPAFAVQLSAIASGISVPAGQALLPGFRTPPHSIRSVAATDVLRGNHGQLQSLRGRVVIVGATALALGDRVMTPRTRPHESEAGVLVHAAAVESILTGDLFREISPALAGLLAAVLVWASLRVCAWQDLRRRILAEAVLVLVPFAAGVALLLVHAFIPVFALSGAAMVTAIGGEARRALRMARHGRSAVETLERGLGTIEAGDDLGERLETLASAIVRRRVGDLESKRVIAHELKTPLSAMRSLSQLLIGFDLTPAERHRVAALLGDETEKLQEMIGGLLEIEQLALRSRAESSTTIDLGQLTAARAAFMASGISRRIDVESEPELFISGDPRLIERIIDNLVGNAVKFSSEPVSVMARHDGETAVLEVMDRGRGVPAIERERIFGTFARGTAAAGTNGLGLGLALVAEAVRWHGGTIEVLERDGGGSIFRVRVPVATAATMAKAV